MSQGIFYLADCPESTEHEPSMSPHLLDSETVGV